MNTGCVIYLSFINNKFCYSKLIAILFENIRYLKL